jgi:UDP-glucose 4-epimerase
VNIGCGARMTIRELHATLAELMGRESTEPDFSEVRSGDVPHSLADISAARDLLGYEPIVSAQEGLRRLVEGADEEQEEGPDVIFRIA